MEALFFYHPVMWWISRQIHREREHCCDDIALRVTGSPLACAKALTALEERRFLGQYFKDALMDTAQRFVADETIERFNS